MSLATLAKRQETADAFLRRMRLQNPAKYAEVAKRTPILSRRKWREIVTHEIRAWDPESYTQR